MANTIHQHGSGDNIAGDKVLGDKVAGNKIGTQINGGNIANLVNEAKDQAQVVAAGVNQSSGVSTAELLQIIASLRQIATQPRVSGSRPKSNGDGSIATGCLVAKENPATAAAPPSKNTSSAGGGAMCIHCAKCSRFLVLLAVSESTAVWPLHLVNAIY